MSSSLGEESRCPLEDLHIFPQSAVLPPQRGKLVTFRGGQPVRTGTGVDVGLPNPVANRGLGQIEVSGYLADRPVPTPADLDDLRLELRPERPTRPTWLVAHAFHDEYPPVGPQPTSPDIHTHHRINAKLKLLGGSDMSNVHHNRIVESRALNRVTSLFEEHAHVVRKIDGRDDFGEDLYISFVENQRISGDTVALQVKGGESYRSARGFRVPVGAHDKSWLRTNVPVVCVVYDPATGLLHWANASKQLHEAKAAGRKIRSISVSIDTVLNEDSIAAFVNDMRTYIAGRGEIRYVLSSLAGHTFNTTDYVSYFLNELGEQLIFCQGRGQPVATLFHSDYGWEPVTIGPGTLTGADRAARLGVSTVREFIELVGDPKLKEVPEDLLDADLGPILDMMPVAGGELIVDQPELAWLRVCMEASEWWRNAPAGKL